MVEMVWMAMLLIAHVPIFLSVTTTPQNPPCATDPQIMSSWEDRENGLHKSAKIMLPLSLLRSWSLVLKERWPLTARRNHQDSQRAPLSLEMKRRQTVNSRDTLIHAWRAWLIWSWCGRRPILSTAFASSTLCSRRKDARFLLLMRKRN